MTEEKETTTFSLWFSSFEHIIPVIIWVQWLLNILICDSILFSQFLKYPWSIFHNLNNLINNDFLFVIGNLWVFWFIDFNFCIGFQ